MTAYPLPDAALAQHSAFVGKVGAGKTYAAKGAVEHLLDEGLRVCIVDPTGAWWGLRSSADGKKPGYPVVVFGGEHADVPIAENSGPALADLIAKGNVPCIIDLSEMLIGQRHRFMEQFAEALHRLNRTPLHLIIDEADEFAPQNPMPETKRMLHQVDRLVRRGRIRGFRVMMISQRPAVIHKNVLTQANTLVAMRMTAPQDRKAIEEWVKGQADMEKGRAVLASLAGLQRGEGWVWAPEQDILRKSMFPRIKTFDSSRAPEHGDKPLPAASLAEIDLAGIERTLSEAVKEAEANDPKKLRARIVELEREARKAPAAPMDSAAIDLVRQDGVLAERKRITGLLTAADQWIVQFFDNAAGVASKARSAMSDLLHEVNKPGVPLLYRASSASSLAPKIVAPPKPSQGDGVGEAMPNPQRKLLTVLALYTQGRTKKQLAILAGYAHNGGAFNNPLSNLRSKGWAHGGPDKIRITEAGLQALGSWEPLPEGQELQQYWFRSLGGPPAKLLRALCDVYPSGLSKKDLARQCGYEPGGGAFNNPLSRLRSLELATGRGAEDIRASDFLFGV